MSTCSATRIWWAAPASRSFEFGREGQRQGHNEQARQDLLEAFIEGRPSGSELEAHRRTNLWLSRIYQALHDQRTQGSAVCTMPWYSPVG